MAHQTMEGGGALLAGTVDFYKEVDSLWERLFDLQHDLTEALGVFRLLLEEECGAGGAGGELDADVAKVDARCAS